MNINNELTVKIYSSAIDNGYLPEGFSSFNIKNVKDNLLGEITLNVFLFTSNEFISAFCKYLEKEDKIELLGGYEYSDVKGIDLEQLFTIQQAIAIKNKQLEAFYSKFF